MFSAKRFLELVRKAEERADKTVLENLTQEVVTMLTLSSRYGYGEYDHKTFVGINGVTPHKYIKTWSLVKMDGRTAVSFHFAAKDNYHSMDKIIKCWSEKVKPRLEADGFTVHKDTSPMREKGHYFLTPRDTIVE